MAILACGSAALLGGTTAFGYVLLACWCVGGTWDGWDCLAHDDESDGTGSFAGIDAAMAIIIPFWGGGLMAMILAMPAAVTVGERVPLAPMVPWPVLATGCLLPLAVVSATMILGNLRSEAVRTRRAWDDAFGQAAR